jgi:hypothetical protein
MKMEIIERKDKKEVHIKMVTKTKNPWMIHLAKVRLANPKIKDVGAMARLAKKSYKCK